MAAVLLAAAIAGASAIDKRKHRGMHHPPCNPGTGGTF
jgi:hypothetical protein